MKNIPKHITKVGWLHIALNLNTIGFAIFFWAYFGATYLPLAIVIFSIAGVGLIKCRSWARMLGIVMSILNLFTFPHGTTIGVYSMIVLFDQEAVRLLAKDTISTDHGSQ